MGLRAEYSLGHSEFNEFLFAFVGEEKSGQALTVLSALARLGIDPWQEAARLSELPREAAASALTDSIASLPEGDWKASDSRSIALRLVGCLPTPSSSEETSQDRSGKGQEPEPKTQNWLLWIGLVAMLVAIFWQQTG